MYAIPPMTGATPSITEAMLVSTSVPETAPAAYNGATVYAANVEASDRSTNVYGVYRSKLPGNVGHPLSDTTWWKFIGNTYPVYNGATNFALGDHAMDVGTHSVYESLIAGNVGNPFTDETKWAYVGATGRWAPFDLLRNTGVTGSSPMTFVIDPGMRINAVGLAGLIADRVILSLKVATVEIWTKTINLSYRNTMGWLDYFTGTFKLRGSAATDEIPLNTDAELTITIERDSGLVTVGTILPGRSVFIGDVEPQPSVSARNFSTIDRKFDGEGILTQRRTIPTTQQSLITEPENLVILQELQETLNAVPAFWVGIDEDSPFFEPLLIVGIYTLFDLIPDEPWSRVNLQLEDI